MAFEPVNELERLLVSAATDPAARPAFYKGLGNHDLFVIKDGEPSAREESFVLKQEQVINVPHLEIDGKPHIPIFTSVERISAVVPRPVGFLAFNGHAVLEMLRGKDLVLNPGTDYGKVFTAQEVESVLDGSIFRAGQETLAAGGKEIIIGEPAEYPHHIAGALRRFFARCPEVRAAYLAHAFMPELDESPHTMIGVESTGDWRRIVEEAGLVVRQVAKQGEIVDFLQVVPGTDDVAGNYMQRYTKPIYKRRRWLGLF